MGNPLANQRVWSDKDGDLWIGSFYDGDFIGARLWRVLGQGRKADSMCYPGLHLTEITDFWPRYTALGRCAIDTEHLTHFLNSDSRWKVSPSGMHRCCQWCGHEQYLRRWTETVERSKWESQNAKSDAVPSGGNTQHGS